MSHHDYTPAAPRSPKRAMWAVLMLAAALACSCGLDLKIGKDASNQDAAATELCTPDFPDRPKDCKFKPERDSLTGPKHFRGICETKCSSLHHASINMCRSRNCASGPLSGIESLTPFRGIEQLEEELEITGGASLQDLSAFSDLRTTHSIEIRKTKELDSLKGFRSLETVRYRFELVKNPQLTTLGDLPELERLNSVIIRDNPKLQSLSDLKGATIEGTEEPYETKVSLKIDNNDSLTSLDGLQGAEVVGGQLKIEKNDSLTSLDGLENVRKVGVVLSIENNPKLPACEVRQFVQRVDANRVETGNNGTGSCD